jgi:hypothetical protein
MQALPSPAVGTAIEVSLVIYPQIRGDARDVVPPTGEDGTDDLIVTGVISMCVRPG